MDCSLTIGFSGPKSSQDFREIGPRPLSLSNQGSNTNVLKNESISLKQFGLCLINEGNNRIQVHAGPTYANKTEAAAERVAKVGS